MDSASPSLYFKIGSIGAGVSVRTALWEIPTNDFEHNTMIMCALEQHGFFRKCEDYSVEACGRRFYPAVSLYLFFSLIQLDCRNLFNYLYMSDLIQLKQREQFGKGL